MQLDVVLVLLENSVTEDVTSATLFQFEGIFKHNVLVFRDTRFLPQLAHGGGAVGNIYRLAMTFRKAPFGGTGILDEKHIAKVGRKKDKPSASVIHSEWS